MNILSPKKSVVLRFGLLPVLLLAGMAATQPAWAANDAGIRLAQIQQERARLKTVRERLESRLGKLGRSLKKLDQALVEAKVKTRQAGRAVRRANARLAELLVRKRRLAQQVKKLKRSMALEAAVAYRHAGRSPMWMDALFGAAVTEIPHRQYMLASLMRAQADLRHEFVRSLADLHKTEKQVTRQRAELGRLHRERLSRQRQLTGRRQARQSLLNRVRRDASLQKQRDAELARQEAALRKLLAGLDSTLLSTDAMAKWVPIRRQKGRLPWPLRGTIVAHFGSRPAPGRPRLAGVELAPRQGGRQVRAIAAGQVRYADWFGGYGLMLIVDHGGGLMTVYAHNDALYKSLGDWVEAGDVLADAGNTGWARNVRLYFEVRDGGSPVNPVRWCRKQAATD